MDAYDDTVTDWIADPELSREEKLARFLALDPEPTTGPANESGAIFEIFQTVDLGWHFRLKTSRGDVVATSEAYASKNDALAATEQVARLAGHADVAVA